MAMVLDMKDAEEGGCSKQFLNRVQLEIQKQLWLALPMMGVNVVQFSLQLVSVMFLGHLGELELAGASIAASFCNVAGFSILLGLASGLETLCGQAYGAKQYTLLGIFLQRAVIVLSIVALPLAFLFYNMEQILLFFGQAPEISLPAGVFARFLIPGLFAFVLLQPLIRFLQTQSYVLPMFMCSAMTLLLHILLNWILIYKLGLGSKGAALAASLSNWVNVGLLLVIVVVTPKCRRCWPGFSREAFHDINHFLKLAIPSVIMCCLEWWSFEALVLMSGVLPHPQLEASVFAILLNVLGLCYMVPWGIGAAASTRISNELGSGRPSAARFSFRISVTIAALDAILVSTTLLLSRRVLGKAFSNEKEVVDYVARMLPFVAAITFMDAIQGVISGVARGCGWQSVGALVNLGAYYFVGLPVGYLLAFVLKLKGQGLIIGIICGVTTQAITLSIISSLTNWKKQAEDASNRIDSSASPPLLQ